MTLARPAYRFTVTNLDNPWTYTIDAGDDYDDTQLVQLVDGLSMTWAFEPEGPPAQMVPDSISFGFFVKLSSSLPLFDKGDRITATLVRPLAVGTKPYAEFFGRITDADTEIDPARGVVLSLICVDPTSELGQTFDFGNQTTPRTLMFQSAGEAIAANPSAIFWANLSTFANALDHYPHGEATIRDHVTKLLNGAQDGILAYPLRAINPAVTFPIGWYSMPAADPELPPSSANGRPYAKSAFYPHEWKRGITALAVPLLKFAMSASDPDRVILRTNTDADPYAGNADTAYPSVGLSVIPGRVVRSPQKFTLNRGTNPNRLELFCVEGWSGTDWVDDSVNIEDQQNVNRYGAVTRTVETYLATGTAVRPKATTYLTYTAQSALWAADVISLVTKGMTDAELDRYASNFAPLPSQSTTFRRAIAVLDIDADIDVTAGMLFGVLAGATFVCSAGELEIQLRTIPASPYFTAGRGGPTITQWAASAYADTRLRDQGGAVDYIDPNITLDHFAVSKI